MHLLSRHFQARVPHNGRLPLVCGRSQHHFPPSRAVPASFTTRFDHFPLISSAIFGYRWKEGVPARRMVMVACGVEGRVAVQQVVKNAANVLFLCVCACVCVYVFVCAESWLISGPLPPL